MLQHLEQVPPTLHKEDEAGLPFLHFTFSLYKTLAKEKHI
jgi:hypothetical protein